MRVPRSVASCHNAEFLLAAAALERTEGLPGGGIRTTDAGIRRPIVGVRARNSFHRNNADVFNDSPGEIVSNIFYFEDFPVGKSFDFGHYEVSEAQIISFGKAFDPRPPHSGPATLQAGSEPTASPWQACAILMRLNYDGWMLRAAARGAPGVDEVRWLQPVRAGLVLSGRACVLNARISHSKPDIGFVQFRYELIADHIGPVMVQTNYVMLVRRVTNNSPVSVRAERKDSELAAPPLATSCEIPEDWTEKVVGRNIEIGATEFNAGSIVEFAYDPQPFHVDETAAKNGPFGALAASGWHTASSWMRAFVIACQKSHAVPETLISISDLRWLRPVCVGDRIAWHFMPIAISTSETGGMIVTSRNSGTNQNAVKVYEFTAKILISHRK